MLARYLVNYVCYRYLNGDYYVISSAWTSLNRYADLRNGFVT